jgi:hypothetical protein
MTTRVKYRCSHSNRSVRWRSSPRPTWICGRSWVPCSSPPASCDTDSLATAATLLKAGTRTILVADLRGQNPEDFAPISASPHNPVVIAIRDSASTSIVDALMLEGAIQALVDSPVEAAPMLRAINDAARISSTADALSAVTAPSAVAGRRRKSGKSLVR